MIVNVLLTLLLSLPLFAAPSIEVQELKMVLDELTYKVHGQEVEFSLLRERLGSLEKVSSGQKVISPQESRLAAIEKAQKALSADFHSLKQHIDSTNSSLVQCQKKLADIDGKLTSEIKSLKHSLQSMLALLQGDEESTSIYIVKSGDSLGQIAVDHKMSIKALKELNQLTNDTIVVGQKLKVR